MQWLLAQSSSHWQVSPLPCFIGQAETLWLIELTKACHAGRPSRWIDGVPRKTLAGGGGLCAILRRQLFDVRVRRRRPTQRPTEKQSCISLGNL